MSGHRRAPVRFHVFVVHRVPLPVVVGRIGLALGIELTACVGAVRGPYHRWSDADGMDVLVQSVTADDVELLGVGDDGCLVFTTGLDDAACAALDTVADLELLDADVLRAA